MGLKLWGCGSSWPCAAIPDGRWGQYSCSGVCVIAARPVTQYCEGRPRIVDLLNSQTLCAKVSSNRTGGGRNRVSSQEKSSLTLGTETWSLADRAPYKLFNKRSPTIDRQFHMHAITHPENDSSLLIQPLQANRIVHIQLLHPHWNDRLLPREGLIRRGIRSEPRAFLGYDCHVFGEEHENEFVQCRQVLGVRHVVCTGDLVVNVCEEPVAGKVGIDTVWVPIILRLYQGQWLIVNW